MAGHHLARSLSVVDFLLQLATTSLSVMLFWVGGHYLEVGVASSLIHTETEMLGENPMKAKVKLLPATAKVKQTATKMSFTRTTTITRKLI